MAVTPQNISALARIKIWKGSLVSFLRKYRQKMLDRKVPLKGYPPSPMVVKYVDLLEDDDLAELNSMLNWNCFTSDSHGRRFGRAAWAGKRDAPQAIPDRRIVMMQERFGLTDKHVLEVGCFEGIHTLGLFRYTDKVTAVDSRMTHVVQTIVRCAMYGYSPTVFKYDIESIPAGDALLQADFIHHVGVLYHLNDPVAHLIDMGRYIRSGVMLDTHYCLPGETTESYSVQGKNYAYKRCLEYGKKEVFSGMYDHSKWLLLEDIVACLQTAGFGRIEIIEERQERNGPRVLLFAERV